MARPQKFDADQVLDAARDAVLTHGRAATVQQVATLLGGPVGSIYHRHGSRDELLIALWLRSIRRFHVGLTEAGQLPDPQQALESMALHIPRYCREHPADAFAMTLFRQPVIAATAPEPLRPEVIMINDGIVRLASELCTRRYGRQTARRRILVITAVQQSPYGLVRPYVGTDVPRWLDEVVRASSAAILALGDRS